MPKTTHVIPSTEKFALHQTHANNTLFSSPFASLVNRQMDILYVLYVHVIWNMDCEWILSALTISYYVVVVVFARLARK